MQLKHHQYPLPVSETFLELIQHELDSLCVYEKGIIILQFKDPGYSFDKGGYHPVEIALEATGKLQYITDFSYVGSPPFVELAKEIDFDFGLGRFQHLGYDYPISKVQQLYVIWESNFIAYHSMDVYEVSMEVQCDD